MPSAPGKALLFGQKLLLERNTSAVWPWLHGTAVLSFGHGVALFSCRFDPVRQSPTTNWRSWSWPVVGTVLAMGEDVALCAGVADVDADVDADGPDVAPFFFEPGLSTATRTTAITTMAAAAPTGAIHRGRLLGWRACTAFGPYHCSAAGIPWPGIGCGPPGCGPPGCWPPHHEAPCWPPCWP